MSVNKPEPSAWSLPVLSVHLPAPEPTYDARFHRCKQKRPLQKPYTPKLLELVLAKGTTCRITGADYCRAERMPFLLPS